MKLFKTVPAIYLFSQILKFTKYCIKLIEKLSRRHFINSFDVFVIRKVVFIAMDTKTPHMTYLIKDY